MKIGSRLGSPAKLAPWGALALRLVVGYGMAAHGYAKLARGPSHFVDIVRALGVPAPELLGRATIGVELAGGLALLLGAFVPWFSAPLAIVLLVAMFTTHLPYGFSSIKLQAVTAAGARFGPPGYEVDLLYLACLAALVLGGTGPFSVDGWRAARRAATRPPRRDDGRDDGFSNHGDPGA